MVLVSCGLSFSARAQENEPIVSTLTVKKVVTDEGGREKFASASEAKPGEIVQYEAAYRNRSGKDVANLQATVPIPVGTEFIAWSAKPVPSSASLDGAIYSPFPIKRKVTLPDGSIAEQDAPMSEYRALRWNVGDLKAGATATVVARARLISDSSKTAK